MQFTRLRLSGFKSFVDPAELRIEPGLTGVVGPNGCGKSNLLEALRWVMGESSAKSMRGAGMDDVIFAGTANRPARNLAEVVLSIDNTNRRAPAAFNDGLELEVSRRIERDNGSAYRINGQEVRARDVQLLFADAATGAHSPALVSQDRVSALINAKPQDRRAVLEEAAGISGLYSRRGEAERRLAAAEANLVRLHDVMIGIDGQLANLRRQAAQARRYKKISIEIRRLQAFGLYHQWQQASAAIAEAETELHAAEVHVRRLAGEAADLAAAQAELAARQPELRQQEAAAAAALHRLSLARDGLAAEEERLAGIKAKLMAQIDNITRDTAREQTAITEATTTLTRLEGEIAALTDAPGRDVNSAAMAAGRVDAAAEAAATAEAALDGVKTAVATARAEQSRSLQEVEAATGRLNRLGEEKQRLADNLSTAGNAGSLLARVTETAAAVAEAEARVEQAEIDHDLAREAWRGQQMGEQALRGHLEQARGRLTRLIAERDTLAGLLKATIPNGAPPLIDQITTEAGYEAALAAALGEDLDAPADETSPVRWTTLPAYPAVPPLPDDAEPLSRFVTVPATLARRLSQTGIISPDLAPDHVQRLITNLQPGQRLVTTGGALLRWDGLQVAAGASSPAALRLAQHTRLRELEDRLAAEEDGTAALGRDHEIARATLTEADALVQERQKTWRAAEDALSTALKAHGEAERRNAEIKARYAAFEIRAAELTRDIAETLEARDQATEALGRLSNDQSLGEHLAEVQARAEAARRAWSEARAAHDHMILEARHRAQTLENLGREVAAAQFRETSAKRQIAALEARAGTAWTELAEIENRPAEIMAERIALAETMTTAEEKRQVAADRLASNETSLAAKDHDLKLAQAALGEARERRARLTAMLEQSLAKQQDIARNIAEDFDCLPERLIAAVIETSGEVNGSNELDVPSEIPAAGDIVDRLSKLKAERDRMGPVNLMAEAEAAELEEQLNHLQSERADLETAIARLRQAITSLNREGRDRLGNAFEQVNRHFGTLFATLFGGGHAHLALTESDDPLEAGLEIMVQPPGKRLQVLSLLSGGEQALTTLSLIFAVFMTSPAPICVLDEVDAPLDDANVERFCTLLDDMVAQTRTRFLIVTHNAVTMSRMNRLFGVTMVERGISQLVSVDLERAEALRAVG